MRDYTINRRILQVIYKTVVQDRRCKAFSSSDRTWGRQMNANFGQQHCLWKRKNMDFKIFASSFAEKNQCFLLSFFKT